MSKIIDWIKRNKLATFLIVAFVYMFGRNLVPSLLGGAARGPVMNTVDFGESYSTGAATSSIANSLVSDSYSKSTQSYSQATQRKVVTNSHMSLLVKNVKETIGKIQDETEKSGGFTINYNKTTPEFGETGNVTVRVPNSKLKDFLETLRGMSVRVVSENISGNDVTDAYTDVEARLATLRQTKTIYEGILTQTKNVDEILQVQNMILNLQSQIDSMKGQIQYMDATTSTTLISVYLATDELALPYEPAQPWRPEVIFREAVRSMIGTLRWLGSAAIWLGVYLPLIGAAILAWLIVRRVFFKKKLG